MFFIACAFNIIEASSVNFNGDLTGLSRLLSSSSGYYEVLMGCAKRRPN